MEGDNTLWLLGNKQCVEGLKTFIEQGQCHSLLIIGQSGNGKTLICETLLGNYKNLIVYKPVYENFHSHKELQSNIDNFIKTRSVLEIMSRKQKVLFFDDVDILLNTNRYANAYIQDLLKAKQVKILMTCSLGMEKRVGDIKRCCLSTIHLATPALSEIHGILVRNYPELVVYSSRDVHNYIRSYGCNIRSCIMNIQTLLTGNKAAMSSQTVYSVIADKGIIDIVANIMRIPKWNCKQMEIWLSSDPTLISYIMYDNAMPYASSVQLEKLARIFSESSVFESTMYTKNDWLLSDICNLWRCCALKHEIDPMKFLSTRFTYTTIPTRSCNYYCNLKKNAVFGSSVWLNRSQIICASHTKLLKNSTTTIMSRKINYKKVLTSMG